MDNNFFIFLILSLHNDKTELFPVLSILPPRILNNLNIVNCVTVLSEYFFIILSP